DRAAGAVRLFQQGAEEADVGGGPAGAAGVCLVEGVVDGVEHGGDHGTILDVLDRSDHLRGEGASRLAGAEVVLVEQLRAYEPGLAGQGVEAVMLLGLPSGERPPGEEGGAGVGGEARQEGEGGGAATL